MGALGRVSANRVEAQASWALRATVDAISRTYTSRAAERARIGDLIGRPRSCIAALGDVMAEPGTTTRAMRVMRRRVA